MVSKDFAFGNWLRNLQILNNIGYFGVLSIKDFAHVTSVVQRGLIWIKEKREQYGTDKRVSLPLAIPFDYWVNDLEPRGFRKLISLHQGNIHGRKTVKAREWKNNVKYKGILIPQIFVLHVPLSILPDNRCNDPTCKDAAEVEPESQV